MSSEKDKQQRMPELFCVEINSKSIAIITGATLCIVNVKKKKKIIDMSKSMQRNSSNSTVNRKLE